jgi:excinuclease ABC subunit A
MHVRIFLNRYRGYAPCGICHVTRLKPEALDFLIQAKPHSPSKELKVNGASPNTNQFPSRGNWGHPDYHHGKENKSQDGGQGKNIAEVQALSIEELLRFIETSEFDPEEKEKTEPVRAELLSRVKFLKEVGLGYLTLDRMSRTLSGGEVERIHLASSLGSALVDTLYVLDEPSIGLHERDNQMLIGLLRKLRDLGNTVVVVEHDRTMIGAADCVIDLGPAGGAKGGELVFQGSVEELKRHPGSVTGEYLTGKREISRKTRVAGSAKQRIVIRGAKAHNLKNIDVEIPLGKFTALTGVSGSGKSTFLYEILYNHFLKFKGRPVSQEEIGTVKKIRGFENLNDMILVDQSPLGRSPRSNPATYMKIFEDIRKIFAATPEARREGFDAGHFSFNVAKGRCPVCEGDGAVKVEMHFLADIFVPCEECQGKRFRPEILEICYQGKNIDQVLNMTVDEASDFIGRGRNLAEKFSTLKKIGLGYLRLGQPTLTLSGGEAQRLKLAYELSVGASGPSLYLLDEPTTGLHEDDVCHLVRAFEELLSCGHSLLVIEHHLGLIRLADHVIDLGPEGGEKGGEVVYQGDIPGLMACEGSYTGQYLKQYSLKKWGIRSTE